MKKKVIVLLHYLVIIFAVSLPFWLDWKAVAFIVVVYHLIFTRGIGYCPLTVWQFGTAEEGFIEKHIVVLFRLFGLSVPTNRRNLKTFIRYGLPFLLVLAAFIRQRVAGMY
ncbi:hypothetical protein HY949_04515 [Candidatus Gottesmanbacteria bacterium]|nr:hypothetical protein [Candidatus Gottesmanbacteria bacterium]